MNFSDQTKRDLATILDTLDLRIHEVTVDTDQEAPVDAMTRAEVAALQELRDRASGMLGAG